MNKDEAIKRLVHRAMQAIRAERALGWSGTNAGESEVLDAEAVLRAPDPALAERPTLTEIAVMCGDASRNEGRPIDEAASRVLAASKLVELVRDELRPLLYSCCCHGSPIKVALAKLDTIARPQ